MKTKQTIIGIALLALVSSLVTAAPLGTAFTYQGQLTDGANPANGSYDLRFALFDAPTNGVQQGATLTNPVVAVSNGLFTTTLDFGTGVFTGDARWLEIAVRTNGGGGFATLSPRQPLTPSPYALHASTAASAANATSFSGTLAGDVTGTQDATTVERVRGASVSATAPAADQHLRFDGTQWVPAAVVLDTDVSGTLADARLSTNVALLNANQVFSGTVGFSGAVGFGGLTGFNPAGGGAPFLVGNATKVASLNADLLDGLEASAFWHLAGNAGTTASLQFLGTTDNQPLELRVNSARALRLEPTLGPPNVIGGAAVNAVSPGVTGATIAGGGTPDFGGFPQPNTIAASFGTVGGGFGNSVATTADAASISGGARNAIQAGSSHAAIGGGSGNTVGTNADWATIGGGTVNRIELNATDSTIAGGHANVIASGAESSTIAGGLENAVQSGAYHATIAGGWANTIEAGSLQSAVAGGALNRIGAGAPYSAVGGGVNNQIGPNAQAATISGGYENRIENLSTDATIAGGVNNRIGTNAQAAAISGGWENDIGTYAKYSAIGGGRDNHIADFSSYGTIAGGWGNNIDTYSSESTIGGGSANNIATSSKWATIAGGYINDIGTNASFSAISGGYDNNIATDSRWATIAGGDRNDIGTNAEYSAIGGGYDNNIAANAQYATIPGGRNNTATNYAFAAGYRAQAKDSGAFVWADAQGTEFASATTNEFAARCTGGARFVSAVDSYGNSTAGVYLPQGGGAWSSISDRHAKANLTPVDARAVLEKLAALPLATWNYQSHDAAIRHVGPMAQDFHAAFGVGENDTTISTVDADGVALAAIQGLNQKLTAELQRRDAENAELKARLARLEQLVNAKNRGGQ